MCGDSLAKSLPNEPNKHSINSSLALPVCLVKNGQNCINRTFSPELDPQYWAEGLRRKSQNATEVVTEMRLVGKPQLSYYFLILEALRQKLYRLPTPCLAKPPFRRHTKSTLE